MKMDITTVMGRKYQGTIFVLNGGESYVWSICDDVGREQSCGIAERLHDAFTLMSDAMVVLI
jgi:hypothetical protein